MHPDWEAGIETKRMAKSGNRVYTNDANALQKETKATAEGKRDSERLKKSCREELAI